MNPKTLFAAGSLLLAACTSTPVVPVAEGPLLPQAAQARKIVVAVESLQISRTPVALLQIDEFAAKVAFPGLSTYFEIREPSPNLLHRVLPGSALDELVGRAAAEALSGRIPYRMVFDAPGFRRLAITPASEGHPEVTLAAFPAGADKEAWARDQGADLVVLIRGSLLVQTGRAASRLQPAQEWPVKAIWMDLLVQTDLSLQAEVRDSTGALVFGGPKGVLGLRQLRPWSDVWMVLPEVKTAKALDDWSGSSEFRERLARSAVQALGPVLPALVPHFTADGR